MQRRKICADNPLSADVARSFSVLDLPLNQSREFVHSPRFIHIRAVRRGGRSAFHFRVEA
jgi:hypothetical protein